MRHCGGCTACCKLIPVEEIGKGAGERCPHVRTGKGCSIYERRPLSCRQWSCLWLKGTEDGHELALRRPDRSHYVLDEAPDMVRVTNGVTGKVFEVTVMQAWCDPKWPMAVEDDKDLLAMIERQGVVLLVRFGAGRGYAIFPPSTSSTGKWERSKTQDAEDLREAQWRHRQEFWSRQASRQ